MNRAFPYFSWVVAGYFGWGVLTKAGFPPKADMLIGDALFVCIFLFFLFLPFFSKIKLGSWLELERKVDEAKQEAVAAKQELREFKNEVRNTVSIITNTAMSQNINVVLPGVNELREQQQRVAVKLDPAESSQIDQIKHQLSLMGDSTLALAKVRIDIERLLRTITRNRLDSMDVDVKIGAPMPLIKLLDQLVKIDEDYELLRLPIRSVLAICNAAMHGQEVEKIQVEEALNLGAQLIGELQNDQFAR